MSHKLSESHNLLWCYDVVVRPQAVQKHMAGREDLPWVAMASSPGCSE